MEQMPDHAYVDDSKVAKPSRSGMGSLVCAGGIYVPEEAVVELQAKLDAIARDSGFPVAEEFKWSPRKGTWMRDHLIGSARQAFFQRVLAECLSHQVQAIVCVNDSSRAPANQSHTHEE